MKMKQLRLVLTGMIAILALVAAGCGSSGGGGGVAGIPDPGTDPTVPTVNLQRLTTTQLEASTFSAAVAINESNTAVGMGNDDDGHVHPILWTVDSVAGSVDGPFKLELISGATATGNFGAAYAINESGMVVGESEDPADSTQKAVVWPAGAQSSPTILSALDGAAQFSAAYGVNNNGKIVGESQNATLVTMPVMWTFDAATSVAGAPTLLALPEGAVSGSAYFISDADVIVGEYSDGTQSFAIMWDSAGTPTNLGALLAGFTNSVAYSVNIDGVIVGEAMADVDGSTHGILFDGQTATDLGATVAESNTLAVNDFGRMAGWIATAAGADSMGSIWDTRSTTLTNFSTLFTDVTISQGYGINNANHVVGLADNLAFIALQQ
jgi:uncharacterized membrane protein